MTIVDKKNQITISDSSMTSTLSQLVYMPNFRAIGQSVWEKNGNRQKHRQKHRNTDTLEFYKDRYYMWITNNIRGRATWGLPKKISPTELVKIYPHKFFDRATA